MDENFYFDDFELSLKEQANQFKMAPSKKVWHGIYNDLHPGRRWPSIMMSLLLIFSIVFIGYINTRSDKKPDVSQASSLKRGVDKTSELSSGINKNKPSAMVDTRRIDPNNKFKQPAIKDEISFSQIPNPLSQTGNNSFSKKNSTNINPSPGGLPVSENKKILNQPVSNNEPYLPNSDEDAKNLNNISKEKDKIDNTPNSSEQSDNTGNILYDHSNLKLIKLKVDGELLEAGLPGSKNNNLIYYDLSLVPNQTLAILITIDKMNTEVVTSENSAANLKAGKKRNEKISWTYYAAPFISSVSFRGEPIKQEVNPNLSIALPQVMQKSRQVLHNATFGYEAGLQMNYLFAKNFHFTVGTHISRSGYNIISNEVHPTLNTLLLKDPSTGNTYSRSFVTHYGDGTGISTTTLHNYNLQASLPVGLQYTIWGNDKIQLNIAANVEPSLVLKADAYILSSDGKNYVNVPDLLREWNFSSNFAPFVTFRSSKFKWNIGPNIRYQWLSTYQKDYTVKEHLIDYGIRIGISK
ncbi:MAG: hypothetical protein M3Z92_04895 [Bacteroidota bacterium]|nr:hypothetical protein [Bacteroidota bacterium]MDQ6902314.1 hypothetical protein [Bacteroidota bacterium]